MPIYNPLGLYTSLLPIKEIGFHQSFAFDFEQAARLEMQGIPQCLPSVSGDVKPSGQAAARRAPGLFTVSPADFAR